MLKNLLTFAALFITAGTWGYAEQSDNTRPNILWIYAEDQSPLFSAYGYKNNQTPAFDKLAKDGVLFENAFMPAPVCSATRSALMTGAMQTTHGVHNHRSSRTANSQIPLPKGVKSLPVIFKEAGYFTFNKGKDDYNFQYKREDLYEGKFKVNWVQGHKGLETDWKDRKDGQPFFGQIQLSGGKSRAKIENPIDPATIEIPPYYPDIPEIRKSWARHFDQARIMDREIAELIERLRKDGLLKNTIVFVFSDHGYNKGMRDKQFCYDGGLHVPLSITWYGNPEAIKAGKARSDLVNGIDISATSLALAGLPTPKHMEGKNLFADDFKRDFVISARDRCDFTIDRIRTVRSKKFRYNRNGLTDRPFTQPQYRDRSPVFKKLKQMYKDGELNAQQAWFWADERPAEEFYDITKDPHQTINLINDPTYAEAIAQHREILDNWIKKTGDKGQLTEDKAGLAATMQLWKKRCVNPEYKGITPEPKTKGKKEER